MLSSRLFIKLAKLSLLFTYLIVLAGGFVRMTGSGMGCPDWPKCFGLLIPPTAESQISWKKNVDYNNNQMLIHNDTLWVAKEKFSSENIFNRKNWDPFKKHSYVHFNVFHTWAEYINRCVGAITGLFVLLLFFFSLYKKLSKYQILGSLTLLILFVLQAWIGGEVVFSVLNPFKITIHMFVALLIVSILFLLIHVSNNIDLNKFSDFNKKFKVFLIITLILSLIQIYFGTQVREFIDSLSSDKSIWILQIQNSEIKIHQLFAGLVFLFNIYLCVYIAGKHNSINEIPYELFFIFTTLIFLILSGIVMLNFHFPGLAQLVHLFSAFVLFGAQFSLLLKINFNRSTE